jgi:hypothetical protein
VVRSVVVAAFLQPSRQVINLGSDEITTVNEVQLLGARCLRMPPARACAGAREAAAGGDRGRCLRRCWPTSLTSRASRAT